MRLYLMQHGVCLPKELDPSQSLSPVGREQIEKTAHVLRHLGLQMDLIVSSPKHRCYESAQIIAQSICYPEKSILVTEKAEPMADPQKLLKQLQEDASITSVFIAGHLPSLNNLASTLLLEPTPPTLRFNFENGGLACIFIESEHRRGTLEWFLPPKFIGLMQ